MQDLFYEIYDQYKKVFENQNKRLVLEMDLPLPRMQPGSRLREILILLLENAKKYTFAGSKVTLGAKRASREVYVFVSDNGVPMDYETAANILDWYSQAEANKLGKRSSTTLPLLKSLFDEAGIELIVRSQEKYGNEFGLLFTA